ncbi:MAG TPA: DNA primase [Candidatus Limnocylindria bacterium]
MSSSGIPAEIKSKLPVLEVVGETVALKRAGSAYKGLCPFHAEKTPSFIVNPDRESWHCFGCGEGGDIFTFVMRRDGLEFREALERLADKAGVELSDRTAREDRHRRRLREALEAAVAWYREVLLQAHQAEAARAYLAERGFSDATLERFAIGYAPNTWDALTRRLIGRGFKNDELIGAGLASPSNRGGVIDKFRGRIIIPIRDASGRAAGLGGRIMPGAEGPKYLNSPAGPLFDKSRTLFALDLAKAAIRREKLTVIVEGYTDVMAAHQAGFQNVVASLGTALTRGQVDLATRYADAVALAYDVDLAGEAATQRGLLEELGPDQSVTKVRVVRIPAGKDPDELIRTDPQAWKTAVAEAKPVIEYFIDRTAAELGLDSVAGKREVTGRVLALLKRVGDPIERNLYLQRLAQLVQVEERVLADALQREPVRRGPTRPTPPAPTLAPAPKSPLSPLEAEALALLLRHPHLAAELPGGELPFDDAAAGAVAAAWRARQATADGNGTTGADLEAFVGELDPASAEVARDVLARIAADRDQVQDAEVARQALRVTLLRLRIRRQDDSIREARAQLEAAQREEPGQRHPEWEKTITELERQREELMKELREPAAAVGARRS